MTRAAVLPTAGTTRLRPLDAAGVHLTSGFWSERLTTNRERTIPHGLTQLEASGALGNFRNAARGTGRYVGGIDDAGLTFPFLDSDVYKWLEAVGWELGRADDAGVHEEASAVIGLVEAAQRADGYLGTFVQLSGRQPYEDLAWGHELYCIGHLLQAAVAWQRGLGDGRLMTVGRRAIDHFEAALGEGRREGIDGHPEIEMALVETFRTTGQERYLALARLFVERRGRGLQGPGRMGPRYWQDHAPVREAPTMTGHAVRQLYLDCGVVDVAVETGDAELLGAALHRWEDMWATRTYLTGALGSRHRDEAFGDAFELPPDRAYAETCAAIASVMLAWRLLLATGEGRFADAIERTLYNAVLPGLALDGRAFFYSNPLQLRERPVAGGVARERRASWYPCACCPPNIMRTLSSLEGLLATQDDRGIQLHQLAGTTIEAAIDGAPIRLRVETDYPWDGRVSVTIEASSDRPWALGVRLPAWLRSGSLTIGGEPRPLTAGAGAAVVERTWSTGDRLELELGMRPRTVQPDARIDAVRGCVAYERGPLVYCLEGADLPEGVGVADVEVDVATAATVVADAPAPLAGMTLLDLVGRARSRGEAGSVDWPYGAADDGGDDPPAEALTFSVVPYFAWANRAPGPMRVWIPLARRGASE